jgi:heme exporter protein D
MHFASFSDFMAMGGYAFYVWLSFGLTLLCLVGIVISTRLKTRSLLGELRNKQAREARRKAASRWRTPYEPAPQKRLTIILAIRPGPCQRDWPGALCPEPEHRPLLHPERAGGREGPEKIKPEEGSACASVAWWCRGLWCGIPRASR